MARRNVVLRATGQMINGSISVVFELEDDKNSWLPLPTDSSTSSGNNFEATAQISDLLALDAFDSAVKKNQDAKKAQTDRILAAQAAPVEVAPVSDGMAITGGIFTNEHGALVEVTAAGRPTREQLEAPAPLTEATPTPEPVVTEPYVPVVAPVFATPTPPPVSPPQAAQQAKVDGTQGV